MNGFGSGYAFYRLNLDKGAYSQPSASILTATNRPDLPRAPWWWGANPNGRTTVLSGEGLGPSTQSYQVYDPDKELLYVYCEWD